MVVGRLRPVRPAVRGLRVAAIARQLMPRRPVGGFARRGTQLAALSGLAAPPACGSVALLATTNHVCQDVAVIPFLWVIPLALYLVTFIIAFDHERWYRRRECSAAAAIAPLFSATLGHLPIHLHFLGELALYFSAMFLLCMVCHGELVRLKPDSGRLTAFYLMISAGGALGGVLVSLIAPLLFTPLWMAAGAGKRLLAFDGHAGLAPLEIAGRLRLAEPAQTIIAGGLVALGGLAMIVASQWENPPVAMMCNFYGVVTVYDREADKPESHDFAFFSGNIMHGAQSSIRKNASSPAPITCRGPASPAPSTICTRPVATFVSERLDWGSARWPLTPAGR